MDATVTAAIAALVAIGSVVGTRMVDWFFGRRFGVGPAQQELVSTLQATSAARADRITALEDELAATKKDLATEHDLRVALEAKVGELEKAIATLVTTPAVSMVASRPPRRRRPFPSQEAPQS